MDEETPEIIEQPPTDVLYPPTPDWLDRLGTRRGLFLLAGISLAFILLAIAGTVFYLSKLNDQATINPPPSLDELAEQFPQISHLLKDDKLGSVYKQFMVAYQEGGSEAAYELAKKRGILTANEEIRMTLELDTTETDELQASMLEHGIKVTTVSGNLVDIAIPLSVLEESFGSENPGAVFMDITGLEHIIRIRLPIQSLEDVGSVDTEGVFVIGADAWNAAGFTGEGIRIGVLDVGFDGYKDLLGSDLPANVTARSFIAGLEIDQAGTPHGAAVSEIIHDIAPDAQLIIAAYQTSAEKQAAVDWLMSQDIDILSSSTGSIYGRRDGKSDLAVMVDQVFAQNVLWVNSSGNTGYTHYRAQFTDTDGDGYHEFDSGDQYMGFSPAGAASLSLNWNDWDLLTQDFDMYVYDENGDEIASSTDTQNGPGSEAGEFIYYEFEDEGPYYMAIYAANANRAVTFDFFLRDGAIEYYNPEYSVNTPGDSNGALTVGAVNWETGELDDYSSRGPTEDGRVKPELVAPAGVNSAAYGEPWEGTSASCPHVTGAAALVMQAYPEFSPQQVRDYLLSHAQDLDASGADYDTGYGALRMGDPPEATGPQPLPPPTITPEQPEPTPSEPQDATAIPTDVLSPQPTATPALEKEIEPTDEGNDSLIITLALLGCIVLPGFIGLGGIGLLGGVFYMRRSRRLNASRSLPRQRVDMPPTPGGHAEGGYSPSGGSSSSGGYSASDRRDWGLPDQQPAIQRQVPLEAKQEPAAQIVCPSCGKKNRPGTHFCTDCGKEFASATPPVKVAPSFCSKCGNPLRPEAKFCPNCGQVVKTDGSGYRPSD